MLQLAKWLHASPRKFAQASAMWLNRAAYQSRVNALDYMAANFTIRKPSFPKRFLQYKKVQPGMGFREQVAYFGSLGGPNLTGWAEQEGIRPDDRKKVIALAARRGSKSRQVLPSARLRKGAQRLSPAAYPRVHAAHGKATALLAHVERTSYRRPFILYGHNSWPSGLYQFAGRNRNPRFLALQLFGRRPAPTARKPWMRASVDKYFRTINTRQVWSDIVRRILQSPTRKI